MSAVALERVSFRYPQAEHDALRELTLAVAPGEVTWLYGRLGAGCSTLLQVATGLAPRHTGGTLTGAVRILGEPADDPETPMRLAGRVGYVTAAPATQLSGVAATVWEEVAFAPANLGWERAAIDAAVGRALEGLGVAHLAARDPATLSGGELQRVVIAAMLALGPDLWVLDEPASALDPAWRARLYTLLRHEAERGAAVLLASEDADGLAELAHRVVVLAEGTIRLDGPPRRLLAGADVWEHGPGGTSVAAVARAAAALSPSPRLAAPWPLTPAEAEARWTA